MNHSERAALKEGKGTIMSYDSSLLGPNIKRDDTLLSTSVGLDNPLYNATKGGKQ